MEAETSAGLSICSEVKRSEDVSSVLNVAKIYVDGQGSDFPIMRKLRA